MQNQILHRLVILKDNFTLSTKFCWQAICSWGNSLSECQNWRDAVLPSSCKLEITAYTAAGLLLLWINIAKINTEDSFCSKKVQHWGKQCAANCLEIPYIQKRVLQIISEMTMHKKPASGFKNITLLWKGENTLCWGCAYILLQCF